MKIKTLNQPPSKKFKIKNCRICKSTRLYNFLSLGSMPIPNGFLTAKELKNGEYHYPLAASVCQSCWLVQLTHVIPPQFMFKNYLYIPSTSTTLLQHFRNFADQVVTEFSLKRKDFVIDIGSNDGTLLSFFKENEMKVLGVDPASNLAKVANLKGINTLDDFFTSQVARKIVQQFGVAAIITATNVVAHVHNLHDLCRAVKLLLAENGVFICEFPYLVDLIEKNEFDTIYHEHLSYFSIHPLTELFRQHALRIIDIKRTPIHGGSIRVYVAKKTSTHKPTSLPSLFLKEEKEKKINTLAPYLLFAKRVAKIRQTLVKYLRKLRKEGKKIVGYGASAKGNVLLNYCKISTDLVDYIVDSISYKQDKFTPGTHIPIYPEKRMEKEMPDFALLLAWNFAEEILKKQNKYREKGGRFIITIPHLRIE